MDEETKLKLVTNLHRENFSTHEKRYIPSKEELCGLLSNTPLIDEPRLCPVLKVDPNRVVQYALLYTQNIKQSFQPYTILAFRCLRGYDLEGPIRIICNSDGRWSDRPPKCNLSPRFNTPSIGEPPLCPVPEVDPNSELKDFFLYQPNITQSFQPGTEFAFRCLRGYDLEGPIRILCNRDGRWSDRPPKCNLSPRFSESCSFPIISGL
ncbi:hypothetical protein AVEN_30553-1 [Araneus ventricosus]|uniref:Sushi domain-containing protein n=1 Tax=Araneus ventricosus TaxID=182803 RepID=A0A4Y2TLX0_ARAVE|nr:hypothetical protein AVEN_30553-1 [Araneus ventricosus]